MILAAPTPSAWVDAACEHWRELLIDHANCEKKAASSALALIFAYPDDQDLSSALSRLAREELRHFEQVSQLMRRLRVSAGTLLAFVIMRFDIRVGGFDPTVYRRDVVDNSDFRKYDDNLRMTLDCTPALADSIERRLAKAEVDKIARFGLHRQPSAIMTCIVPSISESTHVHFVDGAAGGYALAARRLKLAWA